MKSGYFHSDCNVVDRFLGACFYTSLYCFWQIPYCIKYCVFQCSLCSLWQVSCFHWDYFTGDWRHNGSFWAHWNTGFIPTREPCNSPRRVGWCTACSRGKFHVLQDKGDPLDVLFVCFLSSLLYGDRRKWPIDGRWPASGPGGWSTLSRTGIVWTVLFRFPT